ncbi:MAG: glutathione S-transferase family protein [Novosphingobium sp.]
MIKYFFNGSPNPNKVSLFLEESGLAYDPVPIDIPQGQQFSAEFLAINPNGKVPAIDDGGTIVFDSNAILLYLAEQIGQFLPADKDRGQLLSWLMFVATGLGPFSGQAVHFNHYAPELPYARQRYTFEVRRHYGVLDRHLADRDFMVGDTYTIVDMAVWGWANVAGFILAEPDALLGYPNLARLIETIAARPATMRALKLKDRFAFSRFDTAEARATMFKHIADF